MKVTYQLTELDIINANRVHSHLSHKIWIAIALGVVLLFLILGFLFDLWFMVLGGIVGGLVTLMAINFIWLPYASKKQFREYALLRNEVTMETSAQGVKFITDISQVLVPWTDIHKWKFGKGIYLLYVTSGLFYVVPSNAIHQEAEWIQLLNDKIGVKSNF